MHTIIPFFLSAFIIQHIMAMEMDTIKDSPKNYIAWVHLCNKSRSEINLKRSDIYPHIAQKIKPKHEAYIILRNEPLHATVNALSRNQDTIPFTKTFEIAQPGCYTFCDNSLEEVDMKFEPVESNGLLNPA